MEVFALRSALESVKPSAACPTVNGSNALRSAIFLVVFTTVSDFKLNNCSVDVGNAELLQERQVVLEVPVFGDHSVFDRVDVDG